MSAFVMEAWEREMIGGPEVEAMYYWLSKRYPPRRHSDEHAWDFWWTFFTLMRDRVTIR